MNNIKPIPNINQDKLNDCKLLTSRYELLNNLPKNKIIAEVGVLYGDFSNEIINRCQPKELHLIDLYKMYDNHYVDIISGFKDYDNVIIKQGISWEILKEYPDKYFDIIYIDAGHNYDSVKNDAIISIDKIKDNGYIIFNDYILFNNFSKELEYFGVPYVVSELINDYNFKMKYFTLQPYMFFDVALIKDI